MTDVAQGPDAVEFAALSRVAQPLVEALHLSFIRTQRADAELLDWSAANDLQTVDGSATRAEMQIGNQEPNILVFKWVQEEIFVDSGLNEGARVLVELVGGFDVPEEFVPSDEQIAATAQTLVPKILFPFYRETVASMLTRLGAQALMPGLIKFPSVDADEKPADA